MILAGHVGGLIAASLLFLWAGSAFGFTWMAYTWVCWVGARTRRNRALVVSWPSIVILRPCEGHDEGLEENLLSSVTARYDGDRAVIVLVPSQSDPAWAAAERVRARVPVGVSYEVRLTAIETIGNRKVAQLAVGEVGLTAPIVVVADSDIRFDDETLPALMRELAGDPLAGAATAPPVEIAPETFGDWASASVLSSSPHAFLCLAGLAEQAKGAQHLCGALVAYRRDRLDAVGGFAALESYLGEDFEVARRFHERGWTVSTAAVAAPNYDSRRTLSSVVKRFARWSVVTRQQRPHLFPSYFFFLAAGPLITMLALAVCWMQPPFWYVSVAMAGVFVAARLLLAWELRRQLGLSNTPWALVGAVAIGEVVILLGALGALGAPEVEWRGHRYRVSAGGVMSRIVVPG